MKSQIVLFSISILICSCDHWGYAKAVKKDAERSYRLHKQFFKSLGIKGVVREKKYCEKCDYNKYQFIIDLKQKKPETIEISNLSYQPYYFFSNENQLTISVSKLMYESAKEGASIEKKIGSDSLIWEGRQYNLLSGKEKQWLAE